MIVILKGLVLLLASIFVLLCPPLSLLAVACARWDQESTPDQWGTTPTRRGDLPRWARWMQTMDDRLPGGTYEPTVARMLERRGRFWTSVYWIGWRNRAHGLRRYFGTPSTEAAYKTSFKPDAQGRIDGVREDGSWYWQRSLWGFRIVAGHRVYRIAPGEYLAVPAVTIKRA
jgi:hypothetical protein